MKFLIPQAYRNTASAIRPFVELRHAWYAEHKSPLGSCPDSLILDAMTPHKMSGDPEEPSRSIEEYKIPTNLPQEIEDRLASFEDLCQKVWN
jgi:CRISPR-associated protein Csd2